MQKALVFFNGGGGQKRESEATEREKVWEGAWCPPSHRREIFEISCIKMAFLHIKGEVQNFR